MKKAFDQTVRDLKREVNKKVRKVPGIEQKVLDATSNEPWGPHGLLLADIAQATRNHEYQMIMSVVWKRVNDSGKNWRHVYKALTVLDYLVAHGSERVIDEIREHAHQLSALSHFQYIDSSGRDQGSNVRKKSQSLVALVNDTERIVDVRQKAAVNRDKFCNTSSGGMYRPGSYSSSGGYGDDRYDGRYGSKDDDRNGYQKEREWGYKDEDRYSRDGDSYGSEYEERHGRDSYKDGDYRGRSQSVDEHQYGSRSRSADKYGDRTFNGDDDKYSNRGCSARADDQSQDGSRPFERKFSEQNIGAPHSYEEAVTESCSPVHSDRDGETPASSAPRSSSPSQEATAPTTAATSTSSPAAPPSFASLDIFDEFDPRGSFSASTTTSNTAEMDLLGALSDSSAIEPATSVDTSYEATATHSKSDAINQPLGDPFGDSPFKAIHSEDNARQTLTSAAPFQPSSNHSALNTEHVTDFDMGDSFSAANYPASSTPNTASEHSQFLPQELLAPQENMDILADILPPSGPWLPVPPLPDFSAQTGQSAVPPQAAFTATYGQPTQPNSGYYGSILSQARSTAPVAANFPSQSPLSLDMAPQNPYGPTPQVNGGNFVPQHSTSPPVDSQVAFHTSTAPAPQHYPGGLGRFQQQAPMSVMAPQQSLPSSAGSVSVVPQTSKDKFETKSTVWADTLSRGLVNLNISGQKTNPLADIGIDFEAMNRKEKRMEKPTTAPVTSTVTMGKAMGSGSGMGHAAASGLKPPPNPMMDSNMGMGGGAGPGMGMGLGIGYGGMGMGQGFQISPPTGPPGSTMPGGYTPQQPNSGGYR